MSGSNGPTNLIPSAVAAPDVPANSGFDAASPAMLFGINDTLTAALSLVLYGGVMPVDGVMTAIAQQTTVLPQNLTNYVEADRTGTVSANSTAFTPGRIPLYTVATASATITTITPKRGFLLPSHQTSEASVAVTSGDVTLTQAQGYCHYLTTTGALTGDRNVIVPDHWRADVFCNNTAAHNTTFKTAGGSGIVVAQGKRAILRADGTNVVRITADI